MSRLIPFPFAPATLWRTHRWYVPEAGHSGFLGQLYLFPSLLNHKLLLFSLSVMSNSVTPWTAARQASLSITNSQVHQTHVHWVGDAIQPSHPLLSPSPPALNLFQHQGLFQWVSSSDQVAKVLEFQLQHQSFQWTLRTDLLSGWISLQSKGLSRVFSNTTVQNHQFCA